MTIDIPKEAADILRLLEQHGFEAYVVGGCIRDSIIGRNPQDWDIASSAKPTDVKKIFTKTIDTGLKHGTVTVFLKDLAYEITTYRIEGKYINNRRPETVAFTNSIEADLSRRDFTINAMAYNPSKGLLDPFGGLDDMKSKQIRTVGSSEQRFEEDALRMLRAIRFSAQLGYIIEPDTLIAIKNHCHLIANISGERIREELNKTLLANPMSFEILHSTGILKEIMPELDYCFATPQRHPYHVFNVGLHSLNAANNIEKSSLLRWTMLLHDIGKPYVRTTDSNGIDHFYMHQKHSAEKAELILQRLRFDNSSISQIKRLIKEHDRQVGESEKSVRKAMAAIGVDLFEAWLQIRAADISAQHPEKAQERIAHLNIIKAAYHKIVQEKQCLSLKDLAINGKDLVEMGFPQDRKLGEVLQKLLDAVLEQPKMNERNKLLELAKILI
ncbi:MAG: polynucleotide adenylyltransferase [Clostridiales bacterium GWB2_37_7]|nr:MAG: polynucleotide adenylyltransferase [Clostridiales bacterium GWB2_37_7]